MTDRRTFLTTTAAGLSAAALPGFADAKPQPAPKTYRVKTKDGTSLFVKDTAGSGRAVVMTHAWPLNADVWDYQAAALSKAGYRVITYDRRGFGRSSQPAQGYDFDTFADDLAAVIQQAGVRDALLVGYSMGGGEVVRYLTRHDGKGVSQAALVGAAAWLLVKNDSNPTGIDAAVFEGIKAGVRQDRKAYLAGLLENLFLDAKRGATNPATPEMVQSLLAMSQQASEQAVIACVDAFNGTDFRTELRSVKVPTLVLHGTEDLPVPFAMGKATADALPHARLIAYEGGSHGIVLTERDRVTRDLLGFMAAGFMAA